MVVETDPVLPVSLRQYRSRITKWGLDKKVKAVERQFIVRKHAQRRLLEPNKKKLVFKVRGKLIPKAKIERWTREEVGGNALGIGDEIGGAYLPSQNRSFLPRGLTLRSRTFWSQLRDRP